MSAYKEFSGKTVEEALKAARDEFGAELNDLDFEILTPGSRGVLGMGAEPARIVAAPRHALGGAAPKRDAAAAQPLPRPPAREFGDRDRGPRRDDRGDRGPRRDDRDRGPRRDDRPAYAGVERDRPPRSDDRGPRRDDRDRGPRRDDRPREGRVARGPQRGGADVSASEAAEVAAARGSLAAERADLEAAEASPEALAAGKRILETVMGHLGFNAVVEVAAGETSRLNVVAQGDDRDALGALIGRKGERLSALQHLVNLM
ncbi:MAG TPA: Jag N-terminal domain-containing protein, partial [Candidatus Limnocylindrales bacterium]|nr:Jag N-terminal domain-containing protein [Candidatus Limnocylindrales bacterium]